MSFDALTMHAIRDELEGAIVGGFVEKVLPLSALEIGLRIRAHHQDHNLLLSADAQSARVHLVSGTLRRLSEDVTPFLLLMRKYVRGARIVSIQQPPLERVMRIAVEARQDDGSVLASELIIEVMGRHSNVILVGPDGTVLDAIKRVPPALSRQRPVLPHLAYSSPPPVEKLNPRSPLLARQLANAARQVPPGEAAWRLVQEGVVGLGPLAAREAVHRACGNANCTVGELPSVEALAAEVARLFRAVETHEWEPCVVVRDGAVVHFAPFLLSQFPESQLERTEGISRAVERAFAETIRTRPGEALRVPLRASLQARLERVRRKEESLRQALARGEKAEALKLSGQAILASAGQIAPGQHELEWQGRVIRLDPNLSPSENAQRYFKEYAKARDAAREIPVLLDSTRLEREYLEQMAALVEVAEDEVELRTLSRELADSTTGVPGVAQRGPMPAGRTQQKFGKGRPEVPVGTVRRLTTSDGHQLLVGGSARGNERVTFELANGGDLWLHARGIPGAHVILKLGGREPTRQALLEAARIAAAHSQGRGAAKVPVDYTLQRYVRKVRGGPPGLVTYTQERTLRVDASETPEP